MARKQYLKFAAGVVLVSGLLAACGSAPPLPFSNIRVEVPAFSSDRPTTSSVMRVGSWIEESVELPQAKLENVEKAVARLKKKGWAMLQTDMQVNSWQFLLEKEGVQIEFLYRAGRGATVIARRKADQKEM